MPPMGQEKKDEVYGFRTLHREIGYYIARLEQYERSLKFFDQAVTKTPQDRRALIGRSISRAKATQYAGALEDINRALELNPDDLSVLAQKALNTYLSCEFEEGLVQNCRLFPLRQKPENFLLGVMHCTDAIENCVGDRTGRPLRDHFKIIRKLAWKWNAEAQKPFEPKPRYKTKRKSKKKNMIVEAKNQNADDGMEVKPRRASARAIHMKMPSEVSSDMKIRDSLTDHRADQIKIPPLAQPYPYKPLQNYTSNIENYMAEKYLGSLYRDKIFLKNLQTLPGISCPDRAGSKKLKQLAKNGYKAVAYKQELMRHRRPFYFIKFQEATISGTLQDRQCRELEHQRKMAKKEGDAILNKLNEAYNHKRIKQILEIGEKLKQFCDNKSRKLLPDKDMYIANICDKMCRGFYDTFRVSEKDNGYIQEKKICLHLGVQPSVEVSMDSVTEDYANMVVDYKKQMTVFEKRLEEAATPDEACWCYHELTRLNLEMKKFELARVYARKCIQETKRMGNLRWVVNCEMLLLRCNLQQHSKTDAKGNIKEALKVARTLKDDKLQNYLEKCDSVVDEIELDAAFGSKVLEKREAKIINMMDNDEMRAEIRHLFKQMAAMPTSRRMTIMPGVMQKVDGNKQKTSKRMSIMPTVKAGDEDDFETAESRRHKSNQKSASGGVEFMEFLP